MFRNVGLPSETKITNVGLLSPKLTVLACCIAASQLVPTPVGMLMLLTEVVNALALVVGACLVVAVFPNVTNAISTASFGLSPWPFSESNVLARLLTAFLAAESLVAVLFGTLSFILDDVSNITTTLTLLTIFSESPLMFSASL